MRFHAFWIEPWKFRCELLTLCIHWEQIGLKSVIPILENVLILYNCILISLSTGAIKIISSASTLFHCFIYVIDENGKHFTNAMDWIYIFYSFSSDINACYDMPHVSNLNVDLIFAIHKICLLLYSWPDSVFDCVHATIEEFTWPCFKVMFM